MVNYLHPQDLAPKLLDQALVIYQDNYTFDLVENDGQKFSKESNEILAKAINGYRYRKGFIDNLKGIVYRVVQFVKAIFGASDWNKAVNVLTKAGFSMSDCVETSKGENNIYNVFAELDNKELPTTKELNKFKSTHMKVKKAGLDYFLRSLISLTKEKVEQPLEGDEVNLGELITQKVDFSQASLSKSLLKDYRELLEFIGK